MNIKLILNFLDFRDNTYEPFRNPSNHPVYVYKNSNHPETYFRELPKSVSKRLSNLSSNKEIFQKTAPTYSKALKKVGLMNL